MNHLNFHNRCSAVARQGGVTLVELLIALALSAIVALGMIGLYTFTVGTSNNTMNAVRLNHELRNAMQLMTRELRRANYSVAYQQRLLKGNDLSFQPADSVLVNGNCIQYGYRRGPNPGDTTVGAFQLAGSVLQMNPAGGCGDNGWVDLNDPNVIVIEELTLTNNQFEQTVNGTLSQRAYKFDLTLTGRLARCRLTDANGNCLVRRQVQDSVRIRNDLLFVTTP